MCRILGAKQKKHCRTTIENGETIRCYSTITELQIILQLEILVN